MKDQNADSVIVPEFLVLGALDLLTGIFFTILLAMLVNLLQI